MNDFISSHSVQLKLIGFPEELYEELYEKLSKSIFDAGEYVQFVELVQPDNSDSDNDEYEDDEIVFKNMTYQLSAINSMLTNSTVILIDHMWTTTFPNARKQLTDHQTLQNRIINILGLQNVYKSMDNSQFDVNIDCLWDSIWPHLGGYILPNVLYTQWYMMDEVGLSMQHSNIPNMKCYPLFIKLPNHEPFSLSIAWPIQDILPDDIITRDYLPINLNNIKRKLYSLGYLYPFEILENKVNIINRISNYQTDNNSNIPMETSDSFSSLDLDIYLPKWINNSTKLKIFCDRPDHLSSNHIKPNEYFEIVEDPIVADVLYLINYTKNYNLENKISNQFIWNDLIITKDSFISTINTGYAYLHSINENCPRIMKSFNLSIQNDLILFIKHYLNKIDQNLLISGSDNELSNSIINQMYICKKFNSKQGIDYPITNNLSCIIKYLEIGYDIISEYLMYPCLLSKRKFDLRYYIIIKSLNPLIILRYTEFVIRWSNHIYSINNFEDYQKHFTVMNFIDDDNDNFLSDFRGQGKRENISTNQFVNIFNQENPSNSWDLIQKKIDNVIIELFQCIQIVYNNKLLSINPNERIHPNAAWSEGNRNVCSARGMYGIDIILDSNYQPYILEVQWAPDCDKTVELNPNFWLDILTCLYLDHTNNVISLT